MRIIHRKNRSTAPIHIIDTNDTTRTSIEVEVRGSILRLADTVDGRGIDIISVNGSLTVKPIASNRVVVERDGEYLG